MQLLHFSFLIGLFSAQSWLMYGKAFEDCCFPLFMIYVSCYSNSVFNTVTFVNQLMWAIVWVFSLSLVSQELFLGTLVIVCQYPKSLINFHFLFDMVNKEGAYNILFGKYRRKDNLGDLSIDWRNELGGH
jgi:hypothetical protein